MGDRAVCFGWFIVGSLIGCPRLFARTQGAHLNGAPIRQVYVASRLVCIFADMPSDLVDEQQRRVLHLGPRCDLSAFAPVDCARRAWSDDESMTVLPYMMTSRKFVHTTTADSKTERLRNRILSKRKMQHSPRSRGT